MSDFLLELAKNPQARRFIESLGLPIALPEQLKRRAAPGSKRPLEDAKVVVYSGGTRRAFAAVARTVIPAGANVLVADGEARLAAFRAPAEAIARKAQAVQRASRRGARARAPRSSTPAASIRRTRCRGLYELLHPWARSLEKSGRVVVLGRAGREKDAAAWRRGRRSRASCARSPRSSAPRRDRESHHRGARRRRARGGVLRFVLRSESAYVTGQPAPRHEPGAPNKQPGFTQSLRGKVRSSPARARHR
jgi:3-oxoacyl-[acyl-carrier protein] reductase